MDQAGNQLPPDSDLIEGSIRGERKAQFELYQRYAPKMFGVCLRYAANHEEAEDILQEAFLKVFRKLESFRGEGSFEGWMRRIFVNTAIEHFRRKTHLQPLSGAEEETMEGKYLTALDHMAEKDIVQLVQQLPPGYRTVFNLYVVEGHSHRQIAEMLEISEGTSKSQLSRARQILQELVQKHIEKRKVR